jgi:hypothetical protein
MKLNLRRVASTAADVAVFLAGYTLARQALGLWAATLKVVDEAIVGIDVDDEPSPPVAGGVVTVAGAVLHNGIHGLLPLTAYLDFRSVDPLAVSITFVANIELACGELVEDRQTWSFGFDLIDTALSCADERIVGEGDVRTQYLVNAGVLVLHLNDTKGEMRRIDIDAGPLPNFVSEALRLGASRPGNVDDAIERLLDGTWRQ